MDLRPAQIRLHIDQLVMHGVPVNDSAVLGDVI